MAQSWLRTYPLRWLNRFLKFAITPFTNAKEIRVYATHGYYLLGILSIVVLVAFGMLGFIAKVFARLPEGVRAKLVYSFGMIGIKNVSWMLLICLLIIYLIVLVIKPVRFFIGELTANCFFGVIDFGIRIGEWCLRHRWSSLFIVIILAGTISWGIYVLFENEKIEQENARQLETLNSAFKFWLGQADRFLEQNAFAGKESDAYKRTVAKLWDESFETKIQLPDGSSHPALALHKMLDEIFSTEHDNWRKFLMSKVDPLRVYMDQYPPRSGEMSDDEKEVWSLMYIFMGRVYSRLADKCRECSDEKPMMKREFLRKAKDNFSQIIKLYDSQMDKKYNIWYQDAAHNGMGNIYNDVLTPPLKPSEELTKDVQLICGPDATPEDCANLAMNELIVVQGDTCSFEGRRRENNKLYLLSRIGLAYDNLQHKEWLNFGAKCNLQDRVGLANCIEIQVNELLKCVSATPFVPIWFTTTAQAYGASAELRQRGKQPLSEVQARVAAAGRFLRLSYALRHQVKNEQPQITQAEDELTDMKDWGLCYFRFIDGNEDLSKTFWQAMGLEPKTVPAPDSGSDQAPIKILNPLPVPDADKFKKIILEEARTCNQT
jgi:hypothetical protein